MGSCADLPPLTYLTFDPVAEGIGLSQVLPYVERLGRRGLDVTVHSFEKAPPPADVARRLSDAGVLWCPHGFGRRGSAGGLGRVLRGAAAVARADLTHARADLPAASAILARTRHWIWDVRAFWREERVDQGLLRLGSPEERSIRALEAVAARSSSAIITLSQRAIDVLGDRHGAGVASKSRVVTTCVDLDRFQAEPPPPASPLRVLLSGTLNRLYDVPMMMRIVRRIQARRRATLTVLTPPGGPWDAELREVSATIDHIPAEDMPDEIRAHHLGLSIRRLDLAVTSAAATPTKIGEYLACGRPPVVSRGLGDMDELLAAYRCGVVLRDGSDAGIDAAIDALEGLLEDPDTPTRCRALAEDRFDVDRGVEALIGAYRDAIQ